MVTLILPLNGDNDDIHNGEKEEDDGDDCLVSRNASSGHWREGSGWGSQAGDTGGTPLPWSSSPFVITMINLIITFIRYFFHHYHHCLTKPGQPWEAGSEKRISIFKDCSFVIGKNGDNGDYDDDGDDLYIRGAVCLSVCMSSFCLFFLEPPPLLEKLFCRWENSQFHQPTCCWKVSSEVGNLSSGKTILAGGKIILVGWQIILAGQVRK